MAHDPGEPGSLAHPHEHEDEGFRGSKIIHDEGQEGETAIISCGTSKGNFQAKFYYDWSPNGYERATALFQKGFFDHSHFFRVVPKFLVQFGISYSEDKSLQQFAHTPIPDDLPPSPKIPFKRGTMSFAGNGPNSRTSQMFISYGENEGLGRELWETPFGEVIEGMEHIEELYSYGDMPPWGKGPVQQKIHNDPNYIPNEFPLLDKFENCQVIVNRPGDEEESLDLGDRGDDAADAEEEEGAELGGGGLPEQASDDPVKVEQRQLKAAQEALGPFEDLFQLVAVVSGIIVLVLGIAALSRKGRKKKHKH